AGPAPSTTIARTSGSEPTDSSAAISSSISSSESAFRFSGRLSVIVEAEPSRATSRFRYCVLAEAATMLLGYGIDAQVHLSPLTPIAFLERSAGVFPAAIAVVDGERTFTWTQFRERARRLAVALQGAGIERGDRVAFLALNTTE